MLGRRLAARFSLTGRVQAKRERQQFEEFVGFLSAKERFLLKDYKEFVADSLAKMNRGLLSMFFASPDESKEELQQSLNLLAAVKEEELLDHALLDAHFKRQNIAAVVGVEPRAVAAMLNKFQLMRDMHFWLHRLKKEGRALPEDSNALQNRFQTERTVPFGEKYKNSAMFAGLRERHGVQLKAKRVEEKRMEKHARVLLAQRLIRPKSVGLS